MIKHLHKDWYTVYISLAEQGLSQRKIAREMGIHRTTLQHWLKHPDKVEDMPQEEIKQKIKAWDAPVLENVYDAWTESSLLEKEENVIANILKMKDNIVDNMRSPYLNSRILTISDLHIPYHHRDALVFLAYLKAKYKPTRIICLGDELDKHALSYHDSDPDLASAGDELVKALPIIAELYDLFPNMDILASNHGSLVWRKAKTHGIPRHYIKSYNEVLGVGSGWKWHDDLVIKLPNGNSCYLHHGKSTRGLTLSQQMGMCSVQGHFHFSFNVEYFGTPLSLNWAMQCGCLIDSKSYAFSYANVNIKRPVIGTGLIVDSQPVLVPLLMDENGSWVKPADYDEVMRGQT